MSGSEGYEVTYFAGKHKLRNDQAKALNAEVGNDREKLNVAAKLKSEG